MNVLATFWRSLAHYFDFSGRADRREYLLFVAVNLLLSLLFWGLTKITHVSLFPFLSTCTGLALFCPGLAVTVRRLHDVGRSGWWLGLALTVVGIPVLLYWLLSAGQPVGRTARVVEE